MIVAGYLVALSIFSFFIPIKNRKLYILLLSLALPLLYFGFVPPDTSYDLSRYYIMMEHMQNLNLMDLLNMEGSLGYIYVGDTEYISLIYFWLIAKFGCGMKELLPYITGIIVYFSLFYLAYRVNKKYPLSKNKFAIIITYVIFVFNYGEISGVRNAIAFSLAALILYEDLLENKNKCISIILIALLSMVHTSVFIIFLLRIILLFRKVVSFKVVGICSLLLYPAIGLIQAILGKFSSFYFVVTLLDKVTAYSLRTQYNYRLVVASIVITIFVLIVASYVVKCDRATFRTYYEFTVCIVALAFGGMRIDVLIARLSNLLLFMSIPYLVYIAHFMIKNRITVFKVKSDKYKLVGTASVAGVYIISIFFLFYNTYYLYMETYNYFFR